MRIFNKKLNKEVEEIYDRLFSHSNISIRMTAENDPDFEKEKKDFWERGVIRLYAGDGPGSIFGSVDVCLMFRAWEKYTHMVNNLDYSDVGKYLVSDIMESQMESMTTRLLVQAQVRGYRNYLIATGERPTDDWEFTSTYMHDCIIN